MQTRDTTKLLEAVQSDYPIPNKPVPTISECIDIIKKMPEGVDHPDEKIEFKLVDNLNMDYGPDLDGNLKEGMTKKDLEIGLYVINVLLNKGAVFDNYTGLYRYLRAVEQRNPLVEDTFKFLSERLKNSDLDKNHANHILHSIKVYLGKRKVVLNLNPIDKPKTWLTPFSTEMDVIHWHFNFHERYDAEKVEELYLKSWQKTHPVLSFFLSPPEAEMLEEEKMTPSVQF